MLKMHTKKPISRCKRGSTAIEFAILAPILIMMLVGVIEFGLVFTASVLLQGAVGTVSRMGKTGFVPPGQTQDAYIRSQISALTGGYLDASKLTIQMEWYRGIDSVGQPEPCYVAVCTSASPPGTYDDVNGNGQWDADQGSPGLGTGGNAVLYTVSYPWPLEGLIASIVNKKTLTISAVAVVQNEAY